MQKFHKKHDNMHYINKNYVLNPIYNDENECINDTLSMATRLTILIDKMNLFYH